MTSQLRCCEVDNVFGYTLKQGVRFVGVCSIAVSICVLFTALSSIQGMWDKKVLFNSNPVNAVNMIFALFCTSTSLYQMVVSIMLLWFSLWPKGTSYVLILWYVSHMSLLTLYCIMFTVRAVVCYIGGHNLQAVLTTCGGLIYHGVFIYFTVIVNSYELSLDPNTLYY